VPESRQAGEPRFAVEILDTHHNRKAFDCGVAVLNAYLQKQAQQDAARGVTTPYVLVPSASPNEIAGFYTLCATAVKLSDVPGEFAKKLPRYPLVPATLLGRLAVDGKYRGQGLGERLLIDALERSVHASETVAAVAVFVDAKDDAAVTFYERYGFNRLPEHPRRLFIPMKTVAQLWPRTGSVHSTHSPAGRR
jgi:GNAT superfamily N-acetyltransferase